MNLVEEPELRVEPASALVGELVPPGDKSISHRALLLAAIGEGTCEVVGFGPNEDTLATLAAMRALGAQIEVLDAGETHLSVRGCGLRGLREPEDVIDVENAGTLLRLLPGILAGQRGTFTLDGDETIRRRPVDRIAIPLREMGIEVVDSDGLPPLSITGGTPRAIEYELPVASAQVKSCVLLAGLFAASGPTTVVEPLATRDHTERMLRAAGVRVERKGARISVWPVERLELASRIEVPGDPSSAAPFIVAATLLAESRLFVRGMSMNPARIGLLAVLERMGGRIAIFNRRQTGGGEPIADLEVHAAELTATIIEAEHIPSLVDELPIIALAASMAHGTTLVRGAGELKVKESNRLETTAQLVRQVGGHIRVTDDGWHITGVPARPRGGIVDAQGDHRIGMLGAIAGLVSQRGVRVANADAIAVSYPSFAETLERLAQR